MRTLTIRVGLAIGICLFAGVAVAQQASILVGESAALDAGGTQGYPWRLEWFVYETGTSRPAQPDHVSESGDPVGHPPGMSWTRQFPTAGSYTVDLVAHYDHESPDPEHVDGYGNYAVEATPGLVEVKSVRAGLEIQDQQGIPTAEFSTDDTIVLVGSAAPAGATPDIAWVVDGQPFSSCDGVLVCSVPPGVLASGSHQVSLTLTDPDGPAGYDSDTAGPRSFQVYPPLDVDFSWNPVNPDPGVWATFTLQLSVPVEEVASVTWDWGDGSGPETINCNLWPCSQAVHAFPSDDWYTVRLTVTTSSETDSATHQIEVGDPQSPPSAAFTVTPPSPTVLESAAFALDTPCTGSCTYHWSFGDGATSGAASPSHAWATPAVYTVSLTVTNPAGSDSSTREVTVSNCWTPPPPSQLGSCYGAPVRLVAASGVGYQWCGNAGHSTAQEVTVSQPVDYWVDVDSGGGCWGHSPATLALSNCGDPGGNADLDGGGVDAADPAALITELKDGDGVAVNQAGGGDLKAPGGDCTDGAGGGPDGQLTTADLVRVVEILYSTP